MNSSNGSSNNSSQRIEATKFEAPGQQQALDLAKDQFVESPNPLRPSAPTKWWHSQFNMMLSVFGLLALTAILFVILLPPPQVASLSTVVEPDGGNRARINSAMG